MVGAGQGASSMRRFLSRVFRSQPALRTKGTLALTMKGEEFKKNAYEGSVV